MARQAFRRVRSAHFLADIFSLASICGVSGLALVMVVTEGIERLFVIFMLGVGVYFELFGISPWVAAVFWRADADCIDYE